MFFLILFTGAKTGTSDPASSDKEKEESIPTTLEVPLPANETLNTSSDLQSSNIELSSTVLENSLYDEILSTNNISTITSKNNSSTVNETDTIVRKKNTTSVVNSSSIPESDPTVHVPIESSDVDKTRKDFAKGRDLLREEDFSYAVSPSPPNAKLPTTARSVLPAPTKQPANIHSSVSPVNKFSSRGSVHQNSSEHKIIGSNDPKRALYRLNSVHRAPHVNDVTFDINETKNRLSVGNSSRRNRRPFSVNFSRTTTRPVLPIRQEIMSNLVDDFEETERETVKSVQNKQLFTNEKGSSSNDGASSEVLVGKHKKTKLRSSSRLR